MKTEPGFPVCTQPKCPKKEVPPNTPTMILEKAKSPSSIGDCTHRDSERQRETRRMPSLQEGGNTVRKAEPRIERTRLRGEPSRSPIGADLVQGEWRRGRRHTQRPIGAAPHDYSGGLDQSLDRSVAIRGPLPRPRPLGQNRRRCSRSTVKSPLSGQACPSCPGSWRPI